VTIAELWRSATPPLDVAPVESDPFTNESALDDAQVLDLRYDGVNGIAGVLLELRVAMGFTEGNAALLVARGVEALTWRSEIVEHRIARHVGPVVAERGGPGVRLSLNLGQSASVAIMARRAAFYVLEVAGIGDAPPDYGQNDEAAVQAGLPQWTSECQVLQGTSFGD
jgi:hypothetical protein